MTTAASDRDDLAPGRGPSRRQLLRTGAVGAAAAAFLAACTDARKEAEPKAGQSGASPTTTEVAPTVPAKAPTTAALAEDQTVLRTATSLELLVAKAYEDHGPNLEDATWKTVAASYAEAHTDAATEFQDATKPESKRVEEPNKVVQEGSVDPVEDLLTSDTAILDLFAELESMLVATYIEAAGTFTSADWRQKIMTYGGASARRVGVLSNGGEGATPVGGTYPSEDLIPGDAYLVDKKAEAGS